MNRWYFIIIFILFVPSIVMAEHCYGFRKAEMICGDCRECSGYYGCTEQFCPCKYCDCVVDSSHSPYYGYAKFEWNLLDTDACLVGTSGSLTGWFAHECCAWDDCSDLYCNNYNCLPSSWQGELEKCVSGGNRVCVDHRCPTRGEAQKVGGFYDGEYCAVSDDHWPTSEKCSGKWDLSDWKCVQCKGEIEDEVIGTTSKLSCKDENDGDNLCESACGADPLCDEKSPGDSCGSSGVCDEDCVCRVSTTSTTTSTTTSISTTTTIGGGGGGGTTSTSSSTTTSSPGTSSTSTSTTTSTTTTVPTSETSCVDGIDNDLDGKVDCNDPDCAGKPGPNGDNCCFNPATDCIQYDCAVESCGADHECEYTPVAQCTDNCLASDEWCDGVHLNCVNADSSQAVCENCARGHWDDSGAGDGCCGDDGVLDNWCHIGVPGNPGDSCVNGVWHSNHCEDNVHNCDEYTYNGTECVPTVDCGTGGGPHGSLCEFHSVCGPCCSGCNCVNLTIIDRKVSTKTKKENTINLKLKNENYLDTITVELYVENENDLKTCFGKRCDPWEFYFWNGTGWYSPTALVTLTGGEEKTVKFKFRASGPTPKGLYKIEIGVRNPGSHSSCPP